MPARVHAILVVRPDGQISMPLLNDVSAAGLTPEQLRDKVAKAASKFLEGDPSVTVVVKAINSRKVTITGMVQKPGAYPLMSPTTVLQLISVAGGLHEFADSKKILIVRTENGRQVSYKFNYKDVVKATVYLRDFSEFGAMNAVYREYFPTEPPTRATVGVTSLAADYRVEIEVIATR